MLERRRPVMKAWARFLEGETSGKVVPITAGQKRPRSASPSSPKPSTRSQPPSCSARPCTRPSQPARSGGSSGRRNSRYSKLDALRHPGEGDGEIIIRLAQIEGSRPGRKRGPKSNGDRRLSLRDGPCPAHATPQKPVQRSRATSSPKSSFPGRLLQSSHQ